MSRLYLDYNAGAPLRPAARVAMVAALGETGNASSVHAEGRAARARIEAARRAVARLVGADPALVTFTSGGTEANAAALSPVMSLSGKPIRLGRLFVGATEHASVLAGGRFEKDTIRLLPVDRDGVIDLAALKRALDGANSEGIQSLVSVMLGNNETGTIQPLARISEIARAAGAIVHCDAIQAAGRIPVDIQALGVDLMTLSAHKIGGPQGIGALVRASDRLVLPPLLAGGGQERNVRAGTENTAAIAGFGAAAEATLADLERTPVWTGWRERLAEILRSGVIPVEIVSAGADRLPQTLCAIVEGVPAETLVIGLDLAGVAISAGSACSSGKVTPSHVLAAMEVPADRARCAIRLSFGWETDQNDLDMFQTRWLEVTKRLAPRGAPQAA